MTEQDFLDAIERQTEIIEAIAARVGESGKEYASIVAKTVVNAASIWYVLKDDKYLPLKKMLEAAAESVMIDGVFQVLRLRGLPLTRNQFDMTLDEFEGDVLNVSRYMEFRNDENA